MKRMLPILSALWLCAQQALAQLPPVCSLLNAGFQVDTRGGVVQTPDGGVVMTGYYNFTNTDNAKIVATKLDANGVLQWMKTYSTGTSLTDVGGAILTTADGGLALAGTLELGQVFIMKMDIAGTPEWTKTYDDPGPYGLRLNSNGFVQLADGGFALHAGTSLGSENWLMLRVDAQGEVLWSDWLGYAGGFPTDVAELPNGDLVFTGADQGLGNPNLILRKDGLSGATEWMHWYTSGPDHTMAMLGLAVAPDSTIVVGGYELGASYHDAFAFAVSSDGTPLWSARIGTNGIDDGEDIVRAPNGDYVLCGRLAQDTTNYPLLGGFVARLDANGQRLWSKHVNIPGTNGFRPIRCSMADDGGVLMGGYCSTTTYYPQAFMKLDANGNSCPYCPSSDVGTQESLSITVAPDQSFAFSGPWATAADLTFTVADITGSVTSFSCGSTDVDEPTSAPDVTIAPNPFAESAILTLQSAGAPGSARLEIRDLAGRLVHAQQVTGTTTVIERGALANGHYIYSVANERGRSTRGALQIIGR
ncbi:MAG: T9SS type A sorting domain-containing protein [Flavobacteriales bacterium]|nr:T9SS type A sorting domain-containing protein [Flavobacteriales bacterium]